MDFESLHSQLQPLHFNPKLDCNTELSDGAKEYFRFFHINFEETLDDVDHFFGKFDSAGFVIAAHYFIKAKAKGTYFIVHGYYDHVGIYQHIIQFCLKSGYSVVAFDLPGHGLSSGERASIQSFDQYTEVFKTLVGLASDHFPKPWHCLSQSTGSAVIMNYLLTEKINRKCSPFGKLIFLAPLVQPFNWRTGRWVYELTKLFTKRVARNFTHNSNSEEFLVFLREEDFLQPRHLTVQWVGALKEWVDKFDQFPVTDLSPIIIQGKRDETVDWKFNVPAIMSKFRSARVHFLSNAYHQLVNESNVIRNRIYAIIEDHP